MTNDNSIDAFLKRPHPKRVRPTLPVPTWRGVNRLFEIFLQMYIMGTTIPFHVVLEMVLVCRLAMYPDCRGDPSRRVETHADF